MFKRELFTRANFGPGHSTDLSMYDDSSSESSDSVSIYKLPIGVKQSEKSEDTLFTSNTKHGADGKVDDNKKKQPQASLAVSLSESMEAGDYSLADFKHNTSVLKKGKVTSDSKKQGLLSTRAASMLVKLHSLLTNQYTTLNSFVVFLEPHLKLSKIFEVRATCIF